MDYYIVTLIVSIVLNLFLAVLLVANWVYLIKCLKGRERMRAKSYTLYATGADIKKSELRALALAGVTVSALILTIYVGSSMVKQLNASSSNPQQ